MRNDPPFIINNAETHPHSTALLLLSAHNPS